MNMNLLNIFVKVAECGSFTKAAKALGQPKSKVSRSISKLEAELDVLLFYRTTRNTKLTTAGEIFHEKTAPLLANLKEEVESISCYQHEISGSIRITASEVITQSFLMDAMLAFQRKYPQITFETLITNDYLDLVTHNIDIAVRAGKLEDSSYIQKKISETKFIAVCSPEYLKQHGNPKNFASLKNHKLLSFRGMEKDFFKKSALAPPAIECNSLPLLLQFTLKAAGISFLPHLMCHKYLITKELIQLFSDWNTASGSIQLLYPSSKRRTKKVQSFVNYLLTEQFG